MKLTVPILSLACFIGLAILLWDRNGNESQPQAPNVQNTPLVETKNAGNNQMHLVDLEFRNNLPSPASPTSIDDLWVEAMNVPSDHKLIMAEFRKRGGVVKDEALEKDIAAIVRDHFDNDRSAFEANLESKGLTLEEFKRQRHDMMAVQGVQSYITRGITDPIQKKEKVDEWLRGLRKSASPGAAASDED